jgi:hypothetical protein
MWFGSIAPADKKPVAYWAISCYYIEAYAGRSKFGWYWK